MTPDIEATFASLPTQSRAQALALRYIILDVGATLPQTGGITECLKWGQPAYLPKRARVGTTLRIGADERSVALYVPCTTSLVDGWRAHHPGQRYLKNRGISFALDAALPAAFIAQLVAAALCYHLEKRHA